MMARALELARRGEGRVHPNPLVGAVLAKGGRILAEGAHEHFGGAHAEVNALRRFKKVPPDAVLYLTLEPCSHTGKKTPPCVPLVLSKGVRHMVCAMKDPNPRVAGRGLAALRKAGVNVRAGVLEKEARRLNRDYAHWMRTGKPYVTLKLAQSRDARLSAGPRKWISGPLSRRRVHELRRSADAVLVGVNTVLSDDPRLNVRLPGYRGRQPLKVVLDAARRTPPEARIFSSGSTLIFTAWTARAVRRFPKQAEILPVRLRRAGRLDWPSILKELGRRGIVHLLIEGGGKVASDALAHRIVHELHLFVAPVNIGDSFPRAGLERSRMSRLFKNWSARRSGKDMHYQGAL